MSLLKLLLAASSKNASLQSPLQAQQWRFLNVHEYQVDTPLPFQHMRICSCVSHLCVQYIFQTPFHRTTVRTNGNTRRALH